MTIHMVTLISHEFLHLLSLSHSPRRVATHSYVFPGQQLLRRCNKIHSSQCNPLVSVVFGPKGFIVRPWRVRKPSSPASPWSSPWGLCVWGRLQAFLKSEVILSLFYIQPPGSAHRLRGFAATVSLDPVWAEACRCYISIYQPTLGKHCLVASLVMFLYESWHWWTLTCICAQ